jgi:hypothetical protein
MSGPLVPFSPSLGGIVSMVPNLVTRALTIAFSIPHIFWAEAVSTAISLINIQHFRVVFFQAFLWQDDRLL